MRHSLPTPVQNPAIIRSNMTAEIAVLNRNAVALAADSAVTLQLPEGTKIYQANKLFTLSKYKPVGIMIYGTADFIGVPWETIIKQYRKKLGTQGFATVLDYAKHFLAFVEKHPSFFPRNAELASCYQTILAWLQRLKTRLRKAVEIQIKNIGPVSEGKIREMFAEIVEQDIAHLKLHKVLSRFSRLNRATLIKRYGPTFRLAIQHGLQNLAGPVSLKRLMQGCTLVILRDLYWHGESGVVIAGFGDNEFLPSLYCYTLDSIICGRLRIREEVRKRSKISSVGETASVVAFAQSEMVSLFMNGIDDDYDGFVRAFTGESFLKGYPDTIGKILDKHLSPKQKKSVLAKVRNVGKQLFTKFSSDFTNYAQSAHSGPIIDIVNHLPKEELAAMAEALVNLTSFKRHVTRQAETVGGPVDVAVISRGDGFIWIKKKHYFTKDLNPHFLANYFLRENHVQKGRA